jgi:hypothetical protein
MWSRNTGIRRLMLFDKLSRWQFHCGVTVTSTTFYHHDHGGCVDLRIYLWRSVFRVWELRGKGLRARFWCSRLRGCGLNMIGVQGSRFRARDFSFSDSDFKVHDSKFRAQGLASVGAKSQYTRQLTPHELDRLHSVHVVSHRETTKQLVHVSIAHCQTVALINII